MEKVKEIKRNKIDDRKKKLKREKDTEKKISKEVKEIKKKKGRGDNER